MKKVCTKNLWLHLLRQKLYKKARIPLEDLAKEVVSEYIFFLMQQGNVPFHTLDELESFLMEEFYHIYREEKKKLLSQRGQIIVEYIFITMIAITIALIITTQTIKRDKNNPGFIVAKWYNILKSIGEDYSSESN